MSTRLRITANHEEVADITTDNDSLAGDVIMAIVNATLAPGDKLTIERTE